MQKIKIMPKKVLIISSSPRRGGNSDLLADEFMRGVQDCGHNAEKIFLKDKKVNYCSGCGVCYDTKKCVQNDDAAEILEKIATSDVIVLATPVYFYTMSAQLKTLIDRCCPRYEEFSNKEFYFILAAADEDKAMLERAAESLRGFTACLDNPVEKGVLYAAGVWKPAEVKDTEFMRQAYELGRNS